MLYLMTLVVAGVNGTAITVVNGPVAHKRGGASPVLDSLIIAEMKREVQVRLKASSNQIISLDSLLASWVPQPFASFAKAGGVH